MNDIICYLKDNNDIICNVVNSIYIVEPVTVNLNVTPTKETQVFKSENDTYFKDVLVNAIPDEYIIPIGSFTIISNGEYDVTDKASVNVNVPEKKFGTKTITSNGTYKASNDNLDGYSEVIADVQIDIDIKQYMIESDLEYKYSTRMDFPIKPENYTKQEVEKVNKLVEILGGN